MALLVTDTRTLPEADTTNEPATVARRLCALCTPCGPTASGPTDARARPGTGDTTLIGSLPTTQPWLCVLGSDSILTVDRSTLQVLGPAPVAAVEVPELDSAGPGAVGCTPDGAYLYVRTDWTADPDADLVIDAIHLPDGSRTPGALTLNTQDAAVQITR